MLHPVAPPLTLAIQTACLGKSSGASIAQAAFAAVVTPASALSFLFNFLTDGNLQSALNFGLLFEVTLPHKAYHWGRTHYTCLGGIKNLSLI